MSSWEVRQHVTLQHTIDGPAQARLIDPQSHMIGNATKAQLEHSICWSVSMPDAMQEAPPCSQSPAEEGCAADSMPCTGVSGLAASATACAMEGGEAVVCMLRSSAVLQCVRSSELSAMNA